MAGVIVETHSSKHGWTLDDSLQLVDLVIIRKIFTVIIIGYIIIEIFYSY
jgi:hypothetical protein